MSELSEKLHSISTYRTLTAIEAELSATETPKDFNPENPDHLHEQLERLRKREGLDRDMAVLAFRLEIARSSDAFNLKERLALLAAYDPEVRALFEKKHKQISAQMNLVRRSGVARQNAVRLRAQVSTYGVEGYDVPNPVHNAELLNTAIDEAHLFAETHQGERIEFRAHDESVMCGTLPGVDNSFALVEPVIDGENIQYTVPSEFFGISDLTLFAARTKNRKPELTIASFPDLLEETKEGLVANPQINNIRQQLGLLGVNIYRRSYLSSFKESIEPEGSMPLPIDRVRRQPTSRRRPVARF